MSDTRFAPVDAPERVTEPSKRWRNWWAVNEAFFSSTSQVWRNVGDVYPSPSVWPSREVAEEKALTSIATLTGCHGVPIFRKMDTYIGASPDGEAP